MNRIATAALLSISLLALAVSLAAGGVPSAANCTLPACMALCPLGDMPFDVTIRDVANNPIAGAVVTLDFSGCPNGAFICSPGLPTDPYTIDLVGRKLTMSTDAAGNASFHARVGGTGPAGCAAVFASGVLLRNYALASPDQNGNGVVLLFLGSDLPTFTAKVGLADPTADFDCSGGPVDGNDQLILSEHGNHTCLGIGDPVRRRTWGSVKTVYR